MQRHDFSMLLLHKFTNEELAIANFADVAASFRHVIVAHDLGAEQGREWPLFCATGFTVCFGAELTIEDYVLVITNKV